MANILMVDRAGFEPRGGAGQLFELVAYLPFQFARTTDDPHATERLKTGAETPKS